MLKFILVLFMAASPSASGQVTNNFIFKNMDLEDFDEKIHSLPFEFKLSDINQLIFVAPEPYVCGFIIGLFQEEKTARLMVKFSQENGFQSHIDLWKNRMIRYFLLWDVSLGA